jgi:hypothetical protein
MDTVYVKVGDLVMYIERNHSAGASDHAGQTPSQPYEIMRAVADTLAHGQDRRGSLQQIWTCGPKPIGCVAAFDAFSRLHFTIGGVEGHLRAMALKTTKTVSSVDRDKIMGATRVNEPAARKMKNVQHFDCRSRRH